MKAEQSDIREDLLLFLIEQKWEYSKGTTKNNIKIKNCPFCGKENKFEICKYTTKWRCWVCNTGGLRLSSLKRQLRISTKELSKSDNNQLDSFVHIAGLKPKKSKILIPTSLTSEYHNNLLKNNIALNYCLERGISMDAINYFKLG